jgi:L-lactate utilization protein LutB
MENPITQYWRLRLNSVKQSLESNNFAVYVAENGADAKRIVLERILPETGARSVSWGGSMTVLATGLYDALKGAPDLEVVDVYDQSLPPERKLELRRRALLVDLFITGTNAVTQAGQLVNLDMIGNRIGGITFGPKHVVILVGRNKIVADLEQAMMRIKHYVAPTNAIRLGMGTPCTETSQCEECEHEKRICNTWAITEKCFPAGRTRIVLINDDLGL